MDLVTASIFYGIIANFGYDVIKKGVKYTEKVFVELDKILEV